MLSFIGGKKQKKELFRDTWGKKPAQFFLWNELVKRKQSSLCETASQGRKSSTQEYILRYENLGMPPAAFKISWVSIQLQKLMF